MRLALFYTLLFTFLVLISASASPEPEPIVLVDSLPPVELEPTEIKPAAWSRHSKKLARLASTFATSFTGTPSLSEDPSKSETQPRRRQNRFRRRPHP